MNLRAAVIIVVALGAIWYVALNGLIEQAQVMGR